MTTTLAQTPLHGWHVAHGGRMVEFGGWSMPVQYASIVAEHNATRNAVGLFDISHMGRLRFDGPDAAAYVDSLVSRSVAKLKPGRIRYALITNDSGGVKDDVLVYHLRDGAGGSYYMLVVNAGNREKVIEWLDAHPPQGEVATTDLTHDWSMIAVQGPRAIGIAAPLLEADAAAMKYYTGVETLIAGHGGIVSRTGYTGEDGLELIVGNAVAETVWQSLAEAAGEVGGLPAGLGARDTLRLEAAMPLYGHELAEDISPLAAGLGFAVDLDKADYPGREKLKASMETTSRLIGLELQGKRPAREGYAIIAEGGPAGRVTSGTFSPTLGRPIAMGYVESQFATAGGELQVDVRGQLIPARVVTLPFYRRSTA